MNPIIALRDIISLGIAVLMYIPKAVLVLLLKAITVLIAPIIALPPFVRMADETATTGHPSQFPGKLRAFLKPWLMGFQTHDDCLDAFWYSGKYKNSWLRRFTQEDFDNKWYVRYFNYVAWLWRNPAYQFAHWLGWNNKAIKILKAQDNEYLWKTGITHVSYWIARNDLDEVSFLVEGQWNYYKDWCLEYRFGYGLFRNEPDDRCMLNIRFIPWRRYSINDTTV